MKYLILITCFFTSFAAFGQQKMMDAQNGANKLAKLYNLDAAQKSQCVTILETKAASLNELKSQKVSLETLEEEKNAIEKTYQDSFAAILNPDQKVSFQNHMRLAEKQKKSLKDVNDFKAKKAKPVK